MYTDESHGHVSYGYNIWRLLKTKFYSYLDESNLRNVYKHLKDLKKAGFIIETTQAIPEKSPKRHTYELTLKGKELQKKFQAYLQILESRI
jgi:DNA-binding PadR family transcriptional regulator